MKKKRGRKPAANTPEKTEDDSNSSCETRRRIEDVHEIRRYKDELGAYEEAFDLV